MNRMESNNVWLDNFPIYICVHRQQAGSPIHPRASTPNIVVPLKVIRSCCVSSSQLRLLLQALILREQMENVDGLRGNKSYKYLKRITKDFSIEVGTGVDTTVYKAYLQGKEIAVKKHLAEEPHKFDKDAYIKKVESIMQLEHDNIMELLAFCIEERMETRMRIDDELIIGPGVERLFCYEYFPKSLDDVLFVEKDIIPWSARFKIIHGICEGLQFLHTREPPIIHLNLKPRNIMMDDDMNPKITDFGYCRIIDPEHSQVLTASSVGSVGYMAPEYFKGVPKEGKEREISKRFDIYSLGLIIMEITTRNKNSSGANESCAREFIDEVKENRKHESRMIRKYEGTKEGPDYAHQIKCIDLALRCVDPDQTRRPQIAEIVDQLKRGKW